MEEEEVMRRWEEMETDCLVNIFERVSMEDLALGVPLVCKSWRRASLDPSCWKHLDFRTSNFMPGGKFAKRFQANYAVPTYSFAGLLNLVVGRSRGLAAQLLFPPYGVSCDSIVSASEECPRLKALALPELTPEDELRILRLVRRWKDLEWLEMELKPSCFPQLMEEISINCTGFIGLKMSGSIQKGDALAIVTFAPELRYLDLSRSYVQKEELMLILNGCRQIEKLSVNGCIGFQVDKDVTEMASSIGSFEHEGSKLWDCYVYYDNPFASKQRPVVVG